jgi:hypothetical protein
MEEEMGEEHDELPPFGDADFTGEQVFRFYNSW